ncbi:hypothetical protein CTEN210_18493 [Chaetoceros tenuissimus]|uniref:Leucine-rich repeat domain-containing protein n=1 Tax=Chaetoceros tenuissimus TaxID=426638 RepID=A0AAD3DDL4_9STRA|nr:hypothetical protein CTEN210_18493 [Chaetoceros tenuissimus]
MRLTHYPTEQEWEEFVKEGPGMRMYNGKKTLFYNGEIRWDWLDVDTQDFVSNKEERRAWEVIIVLPGVQVIPDNTFRGCRNVEVVIMADTVKRIEHYVFFYCKSLSYVRLSRNLEYIGTSAFYCCKFTSIFIPPSCRWIGYYAFNGCKKLIIFHVPQHTQLGGNVFANTELFNVSPFEEVNTDGFYRNTKEANAWVRDVNVNEEYALHGACCSFNPLVDVIYQVVKVKTDGLQSFKVKNEIEITPTQYLEANPFAQVDEKKIINRYILEKMGETV